MRIVRWLPWLVVATASLAAPAKAQEALMRRPAPGASRAAASGSLLLAAVGGSLGSAAGMGTVLLLSDCGVDDLACEIVTVGIAGAAGVVGATIGTTLVARQTGTEHSVPGAAVGAILGTAVGLGLHYLINRNSDRNLGDAVVVPVFAISQGLFAALVGLR